MPHPLHTTAQQKMRDALQHFDHELNGIRTGRANPALVEMLPVDSYGTKSPLKQIASISVSDNSTISIQPWDTTIISSIEKALQEADLGAQPVSNGNTIRVTIPAPSEEHRKLLVKKVHEHAEHAKISARTVRNDVHSEFKKLKEQSDITEDDMYTYDKELQQIIDEINKDIEALAKKKEEEILTI